MQEKVPNALWVVATTLFVCTLVGLYVAAYFWRSAYATDGFRSVRVYNTDAECRVFSLAAGIEATLTGQEVLVFRRVVPIED